METAHNNWRVVGLAKEPPAVLQLWRNKDSRWAIHDQPCAKSDWIEAELER
jgi:hypothetical protein